MKIIIVRQITDPFQDPTSAGVTLRRTRALHSGMNSSVHDHDECYPVITRKSQRENVLLGSAQLGKVRLIAISRARSSLSSLHTAHH